MKRSLSLDIFKLFLSFFVVAAHLQPLFEVDALEGWLVTNGISRVLVPCFFMINGYFLASRIDDWQAVKNYLLQLLKVYAVWSLFYLYFYYEGMGIVTIIGRLAMGYHHLWYLPALLSGVLILFVLRKFVKQDVHILVLILILYLIGHVLDPTRAMAHYYRNGLFIGFPFIAFGYFIRKYNVKDMFRSWQLIAIIAITFATLMLEAYIYYIEGMKVTDMYLSALLLCPAGVLICLKHPLMVRKSAVVEYFSDLPTGIYYLHLFFIYKMYSPTYNIYTLPWIFLVTALAVIPIIFINRRIRIFL